MVKLIINLSSFYWILFFYFIQNEIFILDSCTIDRYISTLFYLLIGFLVGYWSLNKMIKKASDISVDNLNVEKIYPVYTEYMPIFLAIVVIAFELNNFVDMINSFTVAVLLLSVFILFSISNIGYLNPVWYFFGYRIFKIENTKANYILIAYKNDDYKSINNIDNLKRVDEFVFLKTKD